MVRAMQLVKETNEEAEVPLLVLGALALENILGRLMAAEPRERGMHMSPVKSRSYALNTLTHLEGRMLTVPEGHVQLCQCPQLPDARRAGQ